MSPPQIGYLFIDAVTLVTQLLLARLFFTEGKKRLSPGTFNFLLTVLCILWAITGLSFLPEGTHYYLSRRLSANVSGVVYAIGSTWGIAAAASIVIYFIWRFLHRRLSPEYSKKRRDLIRTAGVLAIASPVAAVAFGGILERTNFHVKEIDFPVPGLHPDLEGFRIAQISDLHVSPFLSVRQAGRVVDMTNELRPNLTVYTGDLISEPGDPLDESIRELARLRADAGVLGCLGNHEYYARCQNYETSQAARYGIDILRGRARQLRWGNGFINVAGVDYQSISKKKDYLLGAEKLVVPGMPNLLLSHNPDVFPVAIRQGYDAVLAGHTHGGQVTVEILNQTLNLARFFTPYVSGLYRLRDTSCYVTPGIGTIGMPVRLGAPPEISLLRLRRA